jgi:transcriptional regulator of acetoin/glycerol metabolism
LSAYTLVKKAAQQNVTVDELVRRVVEKHGGNVRRASIELDVSTEAIYRRLRACGAMPPATVTDYTVNE